MGIVTLIPKVFITDTENRVNNTNQDFLIPTFVQPLFLILIMVDEKVKV